MDVLGPEEDGHLPFEAVDAQARTRRLYPCTDAQRRFWVLDQMDPGNPALNVAVRWRLDGPVGQRRLDQAWRTIVHRHEVLRTFVARIGGELCQVVEPRIRLDVAMIDLTGIEAAAEEAERLAAAEAVRPFSLSLAPLLRVTCLRLEPERAVLLVTAHHIVCDGWSIGILAEEMGALLGGAPAHAEDLPVQYGEYANWLHDTLDLERRAAVLAYWGGALAGLRQFELMPDRPRPRQQTSNGTIASVLLDRRLTDRLAALAVGEGCSMYGVALAALFTLLGRHSGESDIAIGTQFAGRDEVELEQVVGVFINTVVLRLDLHGVSTFRALLARTRTLVADAVEHGDAPFEAVLDAVRPPRDPSRNPLFSVNFIFQRSFVTNAQFGDVRLTDLPSISAGAMYDLNFFMVERPEGWRFSCEYNTDLYDAETVRGYIDRFGRLLVSIVDGPDTALSMLDLLGPAERNWLVHELNATDAPPPPQPSVPDMIAAQVAARPDARAITADGRTLSYAELWHAAGEVADSLRTRGIGLGDRVGVMLPRSAGLVAALLGVMRAGAAYVPLDPGYPEARLRQISDDAELAAVLGPELAADPANSVEQAGSGARAGIPKGADTTAYVIYTSGTTGAPKGVEVGHRALANFIWSMRDRPGMTADDVLLAVTTISFDIAALELFLPLAVGASLVLAREGQVADGAALAHLLRVHRISVMQATPVTWRLLLETGWRGTPALTMLCGGEAMDRGLADALRAGGGALWNMYGPTETTVWSAILPVGPGNGPIAIGSPIANTQLYVLDRTGQLTPPGVLGELYIGGGGVAFGYLGKPALSGERFVADPFRPGPGRMLYRTGDVVRRRTDGTLQFLGRVDHQIKLRGFRIELGAIEATLLQSAAIADCVVVAAAASPGVEVSELRAYVVPAGEGGYATREAAAARSWLAERLPSYMVPARVIVLDALPRTPNGKVDRASLPAPGTGVTARAPARVADETTLRVAAIWRAILGLSEIEPISDFFELGGNSLTAARMLAEVNAAFERALRPAILFRHPTLGELVELLRRPAEWDFDFSEVVQLQPEGTRPTLIALNNTGVFYRLARRLGRSQPFIALQLFDPALRRQQVPDTFEEIASEYVRLILQAQPRGPYALIGWCVAGSLAFEVAQQLAQAGREVCMVVIIDAWAPGYGSRQTRLQAQLTELSLRVQTISRDLWRVVRGQQGVNEFVRRRRLLRRLLKREGEEHDARNEDERYHAWILEKLTGAARRYQPADYDGYVLLLRARQEPAGPFIDRRLGWAKHAVGRLSLARISGDHSTIFNDPGLQQMADRIQAAMDEATG